MNEKIRVVIVDDHPLFRQGLRHLVEGDPRFEFAGEAGDGEAALQLMRTAVPNVAVLDVNLPGIDGLEVARRSRTLRPPPRVVILTMLKEEYTFNRAMDAGALGYVVKESAAQEILAALRAVARGEHYLSPAISGYLLRRREAADAFTRCTPGLDDLTRAERRILKLIADKKTSREIAAELFISPRTVEAHRANISQKLRLQGAHSLLQFALENRAGLQASLESR